MCSVSVHICLCGCLYCVVVYVHVERPETIMRPYEDPIKQSNKVAAVGALSNMYKTANFRQSHIEEKEKCGVLIKKIS